MKKPQNLPKCLAMGCLVPNSQRLLLPASAGLRLHRSSVGAEPKRAGARNSVQAQ